MVKLILHFDINKTLYGEDKSNGKDLHLVVSTALAEKTSYKWEGGKTQSYYDYIKSKVEGKSYDQNVKKRRMVHFNKFIEWIDNWREPETGVPHPKREEVLNMYNELMAKMKGKIVFPSFFKLVKTLQDKKYDFTIVLRTFGEDRKLVADEIERKASLRFGHWGEFKEGKLHLDNHVIERTDAIYKTITRGKQHFALKDNWKEWNSHQEKSAFGKRFIFDPKDPNVVSIFIDDNIKADGSDEDIVAPISLQDGDVPVKDVNNKYVFIADTIQAIKDDDYFVKIVEKALGFSI